jgi:uncharacterized protein (DUF1778 family)
VYSETLYNNQKKEGMTMTKARPARRPKKAAPSSPLMVRLDEQSKSFLARAAQLRRMSVSAYVRAVTLAQARREVLAARERTISLSAEEQMAFWEALSKTPRLTKSQRRLGKAMRGEL